ncbi:hypothetical protein GCM10023094_24420 [Rhodococcus olei]|uniref:DUF3558 domain-containing protein n=1 Tax=Rhodococcus olei TaxID=2161675 RepID=A0ABP8P443_9NOCA
MRVAAAVAACCATLVAAGCGTRAVDGQADPVGVAAGEPTFSPCDDIPDEALRQIGVDPTTESRDILGVEQPGWKICGWSGDRYSVSVLAAPHTLDDVRSSNENTDFTAVEIDGRSGVRYRKVADNEGKRCDLAIPSGSGVVLLFVRFRTLVGPLDLLEPCEIATQAVRDLSSVIPQ